MKKLSVVKKIPRAIYYLSPLTALKSYFKITKESLKSTKVHHIEIEFAKNFQCKHAHLTSHARTALYFILRSLILNSGDGILMSAINIPDMVNMANLNGLKIFAADYKKNSYQIDLEVCKQYVAHNPIKVFLLTHLSGICSNLEDISKFCQENNILLIQDCTQIVNATYKSKPLIDYAD
jgi:dTDP-4-amino-4,6-dideoxygalactose transaminase